MLVFKCVTLLCPYSLFDAGVLERLIDCSVSLWKCKFSSGFLGLLVTSFLSSRDSLSFRLSVVMYTSFTGSSSGASPWRWIGG